MLTGGGFTFGCHAQLSVYLIEKLVCLLIDSGLVTCVRPSVCLFVCLFACLFVCLLVCLFVNKEQTVFVDKYLNKARKCFFVHLQFLSFFLVHFFRSFFFISVYLLPHSQIISRLSICLSVCLFVCLFVCLSVCFFVCLFAVHLCLSWSLLSSVVSRVNRPLTHLRRSVQTRAPSWTLLCSHGSAVHKGIEPAGTCTAPSCRNVWGWSPGSNNTL